MYKIEIYEFHIQGKKGREEMNKIEYHIFPEHTFCTGSVFVAKDEGVEEDDGWLITYVHNEITNVSEVVQISLDHPL